MNYAHLSTRVQDGGSAAGRAILLPPKLHDTAYVELGGVYRIFDIEPGLQFSGGIAFVLQA
jgi:hypothetical protein